MRKKVVGCLGRVRPFCVYIHIYYAVSAEENGNGNLCIVPVANILSGFFFSD